MLSTGSSTYIFSTSPSCSSPNVDPFGTSTRIALSLSLPLALECCTSLTGVLGVLQVSIIVWILSLPHSPMRFIGERDAIAPELELL